jgi:hypothetical protein
MLRMTVGMCYSTLVRYIHYSLCDHTDDSGMFDICGKDCGDRECKGSIKHKHGAHDCTCEYKDLGITSELISVNNKCYECTEIEKN